MAVLLPAVPVYLASLVECVEAWTIVLAVGLTRGWRAPLLGVAGAVGIVVGLLAGFGVTLVERLDQQLVELVVGSLLLLFGVRWLRRSVLRASGAVPQRDEAAAYARQVDRFSGESPTRGFDWLGFVAALQVMLVEGLEISFLVLSFGTQGEATFEVASLGAAAAFLSVGAAGLVTRGPLSRVPDNALKAFTAVMLCGFGAYWAAEGMGVDWSGGAWAPVYLVACWGLLYAAGVGYVRARLSRTGLGEVSGHVLDVTGDPR